MPGEPQYQEMLTLYNQGRYMDAHAIALEIGPYKEWRGVNNRILGGRLANRLGNSKLGTALHLLAYRENRDDLDAHYFYLTSTNYTTDGPLGTLRKMDAFAPSPDAFTGCITQSEWLGLRANTLARLRDFERADQEIARALEMEKTAFLMSQAASIHHKADRFDAAVELVNEGLALFPGYRPLVMARAYYLQRQQSTQEAMTYLRAESKDSQSGELEGMLSNTEFEAREYKAAEESMERMFALSPLKTKHWNKWAMARRSSINYKLGHYDKSLEYARQIDSDYWKEVSAAMEAADETAVFRNIDVPYISQHHDTCAPASLTMLAHHFGSEIDHVDVAKAICYNGTPDHHGRRWAEQAGWFTSEFTLSREAAIALIDRGIPFAFVTTSAGWSHMQLITGYDTRRNLFLITDPSETGVQEFLMDGTLEVYAAMGPRCMVVAPRDRQAEIEALPLQDTEAYAHLFRIRCALDEHRKDEAKEILNSMPEGHRLTEMAAYRIAIYEGDGTSLFAICKRQHEAWPDDETSPLACFTT